MISSVTTKRIHGGFRERVFTVGQPAAQVDRPGEIVGEIRRNGDEYLVFFDAPGSDFIIVRDDNVECVVVLE